MLEQKSLFIKFGLALVSVLSLSQSAYSASLNSSCSLQDGKGQEVHGINTDHRYRLASVSKVFTSYWAISSFGPDFRYSTRIYVTPVDAANKIADVHIRGTYDPYFDHEKLQLLASELNKLNVKSIRNLTFDEAFSFARDVRDHTFAGSLILPTYPLPGMVESSLRSEVNHISSGYNITKANAKKISGLQLQDSISLKVSHINFISAADFKASADTRLFFLRSAPLRTLLKEMNSQSNNWAAEQTFKSLGGPSYFAKFIKKDLGFDENDVRFVNGSGNRIDPNGPGVYNEASCEAVVKVIAALQDKMELSHLGLQDVMAVAGEHVAGSSNTVNGYANEATSDALIAKTGSVNPAIAFAGLASTKEGAIYFGYLYETDNRTQWPAARGKIRVEVNKLFKEHEGKVEIKYKSGQFMSFDSDSSLIEVKPAMNIEGKG